MKKISKSILKQVYKPRNPKKSGYYQCVSNHFYELACIWDDQYASRYGFWRPYVLDVIYKYLDCGDFVVVVNAAKIMVTGKKEKQKIYTRYSGYPGGLKKETLGNLRMRKPEESKSQSSLKKEGFRPMRKYVSLKS